MIACRTYKAREIIDILLHRGFIEVSQKGSHRKFLNTQNRAVVIVPDHGGKDLKVGTLKSIEKQSGLKFR
jgi:predicted RNA binding protein YcfA (HicA-like mRNA interferase family)